MIFIIALWLAGAIALAWTGHAYWTGRNLPDGN